MASEATPEANRSMQSSAGSFSSGSDDARATPFPLGQDSLSLEELDPDLTQPPPECDITRADPFAPLHDAFMSAEAMAVANITPSNVLEEGGQHAPVGSVDRQHTPLNGKTMTRLIPGRAMHEAAHAMALRLYGGHLAAHGMLKELTSSGVVYTTSAQRRDVWGEGAPAVRFLPMFSLGMPITNHPNLLLTRSPPALVDTKPDPTTSSRVLLRAMALGNSMRPDILLMAGAVLGHACMARSMHEVCLATGHHIHPETLYCSAVSVLLYTVSSPCAMFYPTHVRPLAVACLCLAMLSLKARPIDMSTTSYSTAMKCAIEWVRNVHCLAFNHLCSTGDGDAIPWAQCHDMACVASTILGGQIHCAAIAEVCHYRRLHEIELARSDPLVTRALVPHERFLGMPLSAVYHDDEFYHQLAKVFACIAPRDLRIHLYKEFVLKAWNSGEFGGPPLRMCNYFTDDTEHILARRLFGSFLPCVEALPEGTGERTHIDRQRTSWATHTGQLATALATLHGREASPLGFVVPQTSAEMTNGLFIQAGPPTKKRKTTKKKK